MISPANEKQKERIEYLKNNFPPTTKDRESIRAFVEKCVNTFSLTNPVLDIGCGYRSNEPEICSKFFYEFYTLDINPSFSPNYVCNAESMNEIQNETFGCVVCTELLEHVEKPHKVIDEIYRILKNEGVLILTVPFWFPVHEKTYQKDFWRFTPRAVQYLLSDFKIEILETTGDFQRPIRTFALARKF